MYYEIPALLTIYNIFKSNSNTISNLKLGNYRQNVPKTF